MAFGKKDFSKGTLAQLPLEHNVPALDVMNTWGEACRIRQDPQSWEGWVGPGQD